MRKLKYAGLILLALIVLPAIVISIIKLVNQKNLGISGENAISESRFIEINGCQTFVRIRGQNLDNPIIIFVHGGPGFPLTYLSPYFQQYLENHFTFINYDQRGSGRTYYKNEDKELSVELMIEDLHDLVTYALKRFGKSKVILMGQSWGTVLGSIYIQKFPQQVEAYIGVGQVIDFDKGKILSAQQAIQIAESKGHDYIVEEIKKGIDRFESSRSMDGLDVKNLESLILNTGQYFKGKHQISGLKQIYLGLTSPYMNFTDIRWFFNASNTIKIIDLERELINFLYFDFDINKLDLEYKVPVYYIQGEKDYITPTSMVEGFFESVIAPKKKLFKIDGTGHTPFLDSPVEFSDIVHNILSERRE